MRQMRNRFQKLKIGIIGDGVHSKRIQKILKILNLSFIIYKPKRKKNRKKYSNLKEIINCNAVFIVSPNNTHLNYINKFKSKSYIFCEKPPTNHVKELKELKKLNYKKIYFNYNFRNSKLGKIIKDIKKFNFGDLLYGNIITTHNLAQKKTYINSWRSKKRKSPKGVFEIVSIHWIDFMNYYFKIKKIINSNLRNTSKVGSSYDNSTTTVLMSNNAQVDIYSSYDAPYCNKLILVFKNGYIEKDEKKIKIFGPANNYDKNNFTIKPKLIRSFHLNEEADYIDSIKFNVVKFLNIASTKKKFSKLDFDVSLKSNSLLF